MTNTQRIAAVEAKLDGKPQPPNALERIFLKIRRSRGSDFRRCVTLQLTAEEANKLRQLLLCGGRAGNIRDDWDELDDFLPNIKPCQQLKKSRKAAKKP